MGRDRREEMVEVLMEKLSESILVYHDYERDNLWIIKNIFVSY